MLEEYLFALNYLASFPEHRRTSTFFNINDPDLVVYFFVFYVAKSNGDHQLMDTILGHVFTQTDKEANRKFLNFAGRCFAKHHKTRIVFGSSVFDRMDESQLIDFTFKIVDCFSALSFSYSGPLMTIEYSPTNKLAWMINPIHNTIHLSCHCISDSDLLRRALFQCALGSYCWTYLFFGEGLDLFNLDAILNSPQLGSRDLNNVVCVNYEQVSEKVRSFLGATKIENDNIIPLEECSTFLGALVLFQSQCLCGKLNDISLKIVPSDVSSVSYDLIERCLVLPINTFYHNNLSSSLLNIVNAQKS